MQKAAKEGLTAGWLNTKFIYSSIFSENLFVGFFVKTILPSVIVYDVAEVSKNVLEVLLSQKCIIISRFSRLLVSCQTE